MSTLGAPGMRISAHHRITTDSPDSTRLTALFQTFFRADPKTIALAEYYITPVNFVDIFARMGIYPDAPTPPFVPGYEVEDKSTPSDLRIAVDKRPSVPYDVMTL
jgi:hypothetical protein